MACAMPEPTTGLGLRLDSISKSYWLEGREIPVLREVALDIAPGDRVAFVGQSGSGKSTLFHLLGLLDRPSAGRVLYDGDEVLARREDVVETFRNRRIGFVFQFHHLLAEFTALENVMMPAIIAGRPMSVARERATDLLERVGLGARLRHAPGELSGGEQQRAALARALVNRPQLLLADEPTGNLDPHTGEAIHDLLMDLNTELGTTLLVATHNLELARRLPRCLRLRDQLLIEEPA